MGPWGRRRGGNIAGDAAVVGDPAKLADERRESGSGEDGPVGFETERSEAVDVRFCRTGVDLTGVDLRRSSRRELELGLRRGVRWLGTGERDAGSRVERRAGDAGRGVAVALTSDRRFKESAKSLWGWPMLVRSRGRPGRSIDR